MSTDLGSVYSRAAPSYDRVGPPFFADSGRRLVELAHPPADARILDVATGRGAVLLPAAASLGPRGHVVGIDLSTGMLRETAADLRRCGQARAALCQMDAGQLAFADGSFDLVLCGHAIFQFPHAVVEFRRVLEPGGRLCLTVIAEGCFDWILEALPPDEPPHDEPGEPGEPGQEDTPAIHSPAGLHLNLSQAGFGQIQIAEDRRDWVYADREVWWSSLWTLGVRGTLERMSPAALRRFRHTVYDKIAAYQRPDGVHIPFHTLYALATRPH